LQEEAERKKNKRKRGTLDSSDEEDEEEDEEKMREEMGDFIVVSTGTCSLPFEQCFPSGSRWIRMQIADWIRVRIRYPDPASQI